MAVTAEELRRLFRYDEQTGQFIRRVTIGSRAMAGTVAGSKAVRGNWKVCVWGKSYAAHRLAWLYVTGDWPVNEIDHIDGNPLNNSFSNLRQATSAENKQNRRVARKDSSHGFIGVYRHGVRRDGRDMWRARIQLSGRNKHIGCFDTPEQAHAEYIRTKRELHTFNTL